MCGILGAVSFDHNQSEKMVQPEFQKILWGALDLVKYRGPDGWGTWSRGNSFQKGNDSSSRSQLLKSSTPFVHFGHRRLSILDLSDHAAQPMSNDSTWITYNGEIYNYLEIKEELTKSHSIVFKTNSDTEVLLQAYKVWGLDFFEKLNGMWAFGLWDEQKQSLILSRDRFGVKPLYYSFFDHTLYFSSEIKQILKIRKDLNITTQLNAYRLDEFLTLALQHHSIETFYEGIYSLRSSHFLELNTKHFQTLKQDQNPNLYIDSLSKKYWDFPSQTLTTNDIDFKTAANEALELLESSVKLRLRSDVAVGSALSGGLDSSAIVCLISKLNPKAQKTFTASFKDFSLDETKYAKLVASEIHAQGKNIEFYQTYPSLSGLIKDLPKILFHQDGPFITTSMYAQWEVFKLAKSNGVTVTLDGQGADEVFGGYEGFFKPYMYTNLKEQGTLTAINEGFHFINNHKSYFKSRVLSHALWNSQNLKDRFLHRNAEINLLHSDLIEKIKIRKIEISKSGDPQLFGDVNKKYDNPLKQALYLSTVRNSLPALLTFEDRNSMASSVESRTPFLDYRLVELAFRLPVEFHIKKGVRKALLRQSFLGLIPEEIRTRRDKVGFVTPEKKWLCDNSNQIRTLVLESLDKSIFNQNFFTGNIHRKSWRSISAALSLTKNGAVF